MIIEHISCLYKTGFRVNTSKNIYMYFTLIVESEPGNRDIQITVEDIVLFDLFFFFSLYVTVTRIDVIFVF